MPGAGDSANAAVKSADRVFDVFELLGAWDRELSHTELCEWLAIPKSSGSQLLRTLVARGYLRFDAGAKTYSLGPRIRMLAESETMRTDLGGMAAGTLERLAADLGETAVLYLPDGDNAVAAASVPSSGRLAAQIAKGERTPLYAVAGGKAMLAFLAPPLQSDYLARVQIRKFTPHTVASRAALRREMDDIRGAGVAVAEGQYTPGLVEIAVPVLTPKDEAAGALGLAIPAVRYDKAVRQRAVKALRAAAAALERRLAERR